MQAVAEKDFEQQLAKEAAEQLALGRVHLDHREYGAAIAALRNARLAPAHAAAAQNGLAVAYAQLGRADLAERYFKLAMLEAPSNSQYAANLQRLQAIVALRGGSSRLAARAAAPASPAVAAVTAVSAPGLRPALAVSSPGLRPLRALTGIAVRPDLNMARLVRTSSREVRLVLPDAQPRGQRFAAAGISVLRKTTGARPASTP